MGLDPCRASGHCVEGEADDAVLVARAKRDRTAFAPLYRCYVGPIYRYCYRQLGGKEAAEDATSQIFLKALAALPSCREDASFRAWLFTIARNVVIDSYRTRATPWPLAAAGEVIDEALTPEEAAVMADQSDRVRRLVASLPPAQRAVVELRLSGLTHREIAEVLGRSHDAVRTLQSRALARLRAVVADAGTPEEVRDATE